MECIICRGTMTKNHTTDFTDLGTCMVIIKNVPCLKCDQCGETVYTGSVFKEIEKIIDGVRGTLVEIAVINYSDKVA